MVKQSSAPGRRPFRLSRYHAIAAGLALLGLAAWAASSDDSGPFTADFPLENCAFETTGENPYFILAPGRALKYDNLACVQSGECDEPETLVITVLDQTKPVTMSDDSRSRTIDTRVVKEEEWAGGRLKEVSWNYVAQCAGSQDLYYFGEDVDIYDAGGVNVVGHGGAWLAGRNKAAPGMIMPGGAFLLGARYSQEIAPGVALDRAEHVAADLDLDLPYGRLEDCVKVRETSPLEPHAVSLKFYCRGVGLVVDDELRLVDILD